jgi:hypothetical protein
MSVLKRCVLWYFDHTVVGPLIGMFLAGIMGCQLGMWRAG